MTNMQPSPLKVLLDTAGINQVIWIDDLFAPPDEDKLIIEIKTKIAELNAVKIKPQHQIFNDVDFEADPKIVENKIDETLYNNAGELSLIYDSIMEQLKEQNPDEAEPDEDLKPGQIKALLNALGIARTYSYREWKSKEKEVLSKCNENTLLLIDREFDKEGASPNAGEEILAIAIEQASLSNCIMLTHWVTPERTEDLRKKIASDPSNDIKIYQFSVMSKTELGPMPEDAEPHLANALRITLTHRFCSELASKSARVMKDSLEMAVTDLVNLSIYNLDQSIFENSLNEGASELDVVNRILFLRQRIATKEKFANDPETHAKLKKMREIRALQEIMSPPGIDAESKSKLHEWRVSEVFESGDLVNQTYSPLKCGDIFVNITTEKKFILLAQPCDISVRVDGKRNTEEAIFVRMVGEPTERTIPERYFEIEGMINDGQPWIFDFRRLAYVNLRVLDLAVLNNSGLVQITKDQEIPDALLPGWRVRLLKLQDNIRPRKTPKHIRSLSLSKNFPDSDCILDNNTRKFHFQRTGRIRSPYAEAILGSLAAFQTRAAFDHDFTRNLTEA